MKNILIPIELNHTEEEKKSIHYAAGLALEHGMGLIITYFMNSRKYDFAVSRSIADVSPRIDPVELVSEREELIQNALNAYKHDLHENLDPSPPLSFQIYRNSYAEKVISNAGKINAEMFLLCRNNLSEKVLLSSEDTNYQILENGSVPVLVHPPRISYKTIRRILFATNYHPLDLEVLKKLSEMFDPRRTEIIALHISEDLDFEKKIKQAGYQKLIKSKTSNRNIKVQTLITREKESVSNNIRTQALGTESDLIVVLKEQKNIFEKILKTSVSKKLAHESELPVMVFSGRTKGNKKQK